MSEDKTTPAQIVGDLWEAWCRLPPPRHERFGQYAVNRLGRSEPMPSVFYEPDPDIARQRLIEALEAERGR